MSKLGTSWMFSIRVNCKVGMKWATIEKEEGVKILLKYVCCVIWRLHIQIHTLFAVGHHQKMKQGVFGMGWLMLILMLMLQKNGLQESNRTPLLLPLIPASVHTPTFCHHSIPSLLIIDPLLPPYIISYYSSTFTINSTTTTPKCTLSWRLVVPSPSSGYDHFFEFRGGRLRELRLCIFFPNI